MIGSMVEIYNIEIKSNSDYTPKMQYSKELLLVHPLVSFPLGTVQDRGSSIF